MATGARLTVFDGASSIGGTKILLEQGGTRLFLDFGTNYQRMGEYFEEYLQPRPARGLVDLIELGLLPRRRGLYRPDLFPSHDYPDRDRDWDGEPPTAILLTHGHLDHCGGIAYTDPTIPIVATPMTVALLRSWQETGGSSVASEITYFGRRVPVEREGSAGSLPGRLLATERGVPRRGRDFRLLGDVPGPLVEALRRSPVSEKVGFEPRDPEGAPSAFGDLRFRHHGVDHSVYGASGFLVETEGGLLAYTGDLRFAGERGPESEGFLQLLEAKHPDLLIVEGTRLHRPGDRAPQPVRTEDDVERNCRAEVERYPGRLVVADFGPRNVERLRRFRRISLDTGRQLVLTPKDAFLLHLLHSVDPRIEVDLSTGGMRVLEEPSVGFERGWKSEVSRRYADAFLNPTDIARSPGRWILCFSFFDCNDLVDLKLEGATSGGLWLYSSSEAHGEEQEFDFVRLQRWIRWAGMDQIGFRYLPDATGTPVLSFEHPDDVGHHASGHATEAELVELIRRASPGLVVPVHTTQTPERYREILAEHGADARVAPVTSGRPITW